jgi:hypothetical protein
VADLSRGSRPHASHHEEGRVTVAPYGLSGDVRSDWADLGAPTGGPAPFRPEMTTGLPEPARRWLTHAITPGPPLLTAVEQVTHGQVNLGGWRSFTAVQRVSAVRGFVWSASLRRYGLPVVGFDRFSRYTGQRRWRAFDAVPISTADGPDVTRGAAGRHAGEVLVAVPAAALSPQVKWRPIDADRAAARIKVGSGFHEVVLTVAGTGALTSITLTRWGVTGDGSYADRVYGADLGAEATFDGFTVPAAVTTGWDHGTAGWTAGQSMRSTIDSAHYR